jgi:hypothetical protein
MSLRRWAHARKGNVQRGSSSHVVEAREAGLGSRHTPYASSKQQHQSVDGASRRRAAPGNQPMDLEALLRFGQHSIHRSISMALCWHPMSVIEHRPNPSIEGTSNIWLRQLSAAPHVKR